jgi:hypothetical protein
MQGLLIGIANAITGMRSGASAAATIFAAYKARVIADGGVVENDACTIAFLESIGAGTDIIPLFDADAIAFFDRVTAASGSLNTTEQDAVNTLVVQMKADGIWDSMKAIYPMVGASAAACAQNLKSSSFTGSFSSGWTFASTGASTVKGLGSFMDTNLLANTELSSADSHLSYYCRNNLLGNSNVLAGDNGINSAWFGLYRDVNVYYAALSGVYETTSILGINTPAFWLSNKTNTTTLKFIRNSVILATKTVTAGTFASTQNIYLNNFNTSGVFSSGAECAFASIGNSFTDTQAVNFYTAVQAFQTTLSRQV